MLFENFTLPGEFSAGIFVSEMSSSGCKLSDDRIVVICCRQRQTVIHVQCRDPTCGCVCMPNASTSAVAMPPMIIAHCIMK